MSTDINQPVVGAVAWYHRGEVNFDAQAALALLDDGNGTPINLYIGAAPAPLANGGSAFPQHGWSSDPKVVERMQEQGGMTLRDYFAAKAITGTCPGGAIQDGEIARYASWAYRMADAMLAERAK